ncbi:hypothetical protein AAHA92_01091 [Salvia divinorum]|uniref:VQ domain-containing protein n=1 Tax=Salvia divinorum TaxID=28513 RepID=A0ABD1ILQ4_SALDI
MDSANSGSLQSSSGGDEEYDSRAVDSVFMSGNNAAPQFLEPLPGYLHLHQNPSPLLLNSSNPSWPLGSNPNSIGPHSMFPGAVPHSMFLENSPSASPINNTTLVQQATRNPKKRSRASRRAPTTVLTTDTTNFRAMVQEFTGIPAPPFNTSSFPRSRLDFFGSRSTPAANSAQPPPYLRRPFAQKVHPPHPFFSSSPATTNTATSTSINYRLPNLFNIPNQNQNQNILTSLLQSNPKFPFSTTSVAVSKAQNSFEIIQNDDQFGISHHNQVSETLSGLPSLIPSDHNHNHNHTGGASNVAKWGTDKSDLRHLDSGSYDFERSEIGGKISNFSASSTSGLHGEKSPENNAAATRGEGMVESWICSSE